MTSPESRHDDIYLEQDRDSECSFCDGFIPEIGRTTLEFAQVYPNLSEMGQVIDSSRNFSLIPDISPITQDHILVLTNSHFPSFSSIPASTKDECVKFVKKTLDKMVSLHEDSEVLVFEHGMGSIDDQTIRCGGCGRTDHAHLHMLPISSEDVAEQISVGEELVDAILNMYPLKKNNIEPIPSFDINEQTGGYPYLYIWSNKMKEACVLVQDSDKITVESQLIRRLLATRLFGAKADNRDEWDWRDFILLHQKKGEQMNQNTLKRWGQERWQNEL